MNKWLDQLGDLINETIRSANEWLQEQGWFEELRTRWHELEPRSRTYLIVGAGALGGFVSLLIGVSVLSGVSSLRSEYTAKLETQGALERAHNESKQLRQIAPALTSASGDSEAPTAAWAPHVEQIAQESNIDKTNLLLSPETPSGGSEIAKASSLDIELKNISIKQLVNFVVKLETSGRPIRIDELDIQTIGNEGFLLAKAKMTGLTLKK